ncbi:MAG: ATP-binding protein [Salinarimonadaceae bacterium]|nr:MAG: ATP-binding protein [Salinarimonadaceae bacterium]
MSWSPQQETAIKAVKAWLKDPSQQVFKLFGFAGTGKTTLAKELAAGVKGKVLYGAFTGKAALVLRSKGCDGASTIHSMIYKLDDESRWEPTFTLNPMSEVRNAKLVIIDEVSMVGEALAADLLSFGTKVLVLGDPAQLPPVKDEGYFIKGEPDVMLTEVHRQAEGNPIIRMSMMIREGQNLECGTFGDSKVIPRAALGQREILAADQVLVGLNRTRHTVNGKIRHLLGRDPDGPQIGDKLVCLRNDREKKLLNGGLWLVDDILMDAPDSIRMLVTSDDHVENSATEVRVLRPFFEGREKDIPWEEKRGTQEFTYGYALTTHKSQGSQWGHVVVFDESSAFREDRAKWLYTAVTRAAERVTVVRS